MKGHIQNPLVTIKTLLKKLCKVVEHEAVITPPIPKSLSIESLRS